MFTSRAEYRLMLREDNADQRLTAKGRELGLVDDARWAAFSEKMERIEQESQRLRGLWALPHNELGQAFVTRTGEALSKEQSAYDLLKRPQVGWPVVRDLTGSHVADAVGEQIEIAVKYAGYIDRQKDDIALLQRHEQTTIPEAFDYREVSGLSREITAKLEQVRPATLGQASRIPGVTPAAVQLLMIMLKKHRSKASA